MGQYNIDTKKYLTNNDTLFEHMMLANIDGTPSGLSSGTSFDSFSRLKVSNPFTLFDSSHRYSDNGLWATSTSGTGSADHDANQGLINMTIGATSGDKVYRETYKVFAYQPGKSLLVLNTFSFGAAKTGLRQRVGYFGSENGIYIERDSDGTIYFVKRTKVGGSVSNIRVAQADWNQDILDGTTITGITLDLSKVQILWMDFEWLGAGSVRIGFIINGKFIHCHTFYHSNIIDATYITTACLPLRYEIENLANTNSGSTLKQICSSVISEGGYELSGISTAISTSIASPKILTTAGTYYPVFSVRLKSAQLDGIVIPVGVHIAHASGNSATYQWQLVEGGTLTAPDSVWTSGSSYEYKTNGTSLSGGSVISTGFFTSTNQSSSASEVLKPLLFKHQLKRDSFTSTATLLTLLAVTTNSGNGIVASMDFEEVTK